MRGENHPKYYSLTSAVRSYQSSLGPPPVTDRSRHMTIPFPATLGRPGASRASGDRAPCRRSCT